MKIILPRYEVAEKEIDGPLFYLAGPIKGGGYWQEKAYLLLQTAMGDQNFTVATPVRHKPNDPLYSGSLLGQRTGIFARQRTWEHNYMTMAASQIGCLMFWLGAEDPNEPRADGIRNADGTTYELAEWFSFLRSGDPWNRVVIGGEAGFPELEGWRKRFGGPPTNLCFQPTLEATVRHAVAVARQAS